MLTVSKPPARNASIDDGGARKVKSLFSGVPPVAIADSRLPIARSAADRMGANGPMADAGSRASLVAIAPSKSMSPAKAIVTGCADEVVEAFGAVDVTVDGAVGVVAENIEVAPADEATGGGPADVSDGPELHPATSVSVPHPSAIAALRGPPRIGGA